MERHGSLSETDKRVRPKNAARYRARPPIVFVSVVALSLGACGGGGDDDAEETMASADAEAASETTSTAPPTTASIVTSTEPSSTTTPVATDAPPVEESEPTTPDAPIPSEIVITEPGLYPEGLTYDPVGDRFIVGSLLGGQLLAVADDGSTTPFADSPGSNLTGIEADAQRNRLLVAVTGLPFGNAQLSVHDLTTGEQLELVDFALIQPDDRRFANGIAVDADGIVYVTDTGTGVVYAVDSSYTPSVFAENDAFEPDRSGPTASGLNGIVVAGDALIVGHAPTGQLFRVPLTDPSRVTVVPTGVEGMRIDGLHLSDDGSTLAVVSNFGSVHLFESSDGWSTTSEVGRFDVGDAFPTSVTDRDGTFFVLLSHLNEIANPPVDRYEIVPLTAP